MLLRHSSPFLIGALLAVGGGCRPAVHPAGAKLPVGPESRRWTALYDYQVASRTMTPEAAARRWLELLYAPPRAEGKRVGFSTLGGIHVVGFRDLVMALPSPEAWPAIADGIRKRTSGQPKGLKNTSLNLFAELLAGDSAAQWKALEAIRAVGKVEVDKSDLVANLARATGDEGRYRSWVVATLKGGPSRSAPSIYVPDLVSWVGAPQAERWISDLLVRHPAAIAAIQGDETKALAKRLALQKSTSLSNAPWGIVDSPDDLPLIEAFVTRWGESGASKVAADRVAGLIKAGRDEDALRQAIADDSDFGYGGSEESDFVVRDSLGRPGFFRLSQRLFRKVGVHGSGWQFAESALASGQLEEFERTIQEALRKPKLDDHSRQALRDVLLEMRLATGRVNSALDLLRKMASDSEPNEDTRIQRAVEIARLGSALSFPKVEQEGIALAEKLDADRKRRFLISISKAYIDLLIDLGRNAEAEKLLVESYRQEAKTLYDEPRFINGAWIVPRRSGSLFELASFYYRTGRPQELRSLLDAAPEWGVVDVAAFGRGNTTVYADAEMVPPALMAAWALAETGERGMARTLLDRILTDSSGYDPAYRLSIELADDDAIPELDRLLTLNPRQERPLIWKAIVLQEKGRLEEAAMAVRRAIALDASDEKTPIARRRFAHKVLSEILTAKGEGKEAEIHARLWRASQKLSDAAKLQKLGLRSQALQIRLEALRNVDDPIERLQAGAELEAFGRREEAEAQYKAAYGTLARSLPQIVPDALRRTGVLYPTLLARRAAESILETAPANSSALYFLGRLRMEVGRLNEARSLLQRAIKADPENAEAAESLEWCDYASPVFRTGMRVPTFAESWRKAERGLSSRSLGMPESIYPLKASRIQIQKEIGLAEGRIFYRDFLGFALSSPGDAILRMSVVESIAELIDGT
ncbi:tetratricopeptide repeat protein [bacterium]|nr:MAG: tetratricopeptide repeat protein [bacterium]